MTRPPDEVFVAVRDVDPDCLDAEQLDDYLGHLARLRAWCDARQVRATRRQRQLANDGRAADPRHSLARHGRQSGKEARAADERERVCGALPSFELALADGAVSPGHLDAIASVTARLDQPAAAEFVGEAASLLTDATRHGVDTFARHCRDLARSIQARHHHNADVDELEQQKARSKISRWVDRTTGMHHTHIEADPLSDRIVWTAIQRERARLRRRQQHTPQEGLPNTSWDRLNVDALLLAIGGSAPDEPPTARLRREPEIVVHVDLATLAEGRHINSMCETDSGAQLPVETVRRMACTAHIIPAVLGGDGTVLDVGRARRLATAEQRTALAAMQSTCAHPNCSVTFDECRIHHLTPWSQGGSTDLGNLVAVCETHHHLIHEGGWNLSLDGTRMAMWTRPDGHVEYVTAISNRRERPTEITGIGAEVHADQAPSRRCGVTR